MLPDFSKKGERRYVSNPRTEHIEKKAVVPKKELLELLDIATQDVYTDDPVHAARVERMRWLSLKMLQSVQDWPHGHAT